MENSRLWLNPLDERLNEEPAMNLTPDPRVVLQERAIPEPSTGSSNSVITVTSDHLEHILHHTEAVAVVIILVVSLLSNGLVILLFYRKPTTRTFSNRFVLNLSLTHLLQSVLVIPNVLVSTITDTWVFGDIWCQVSGTLSICLTVEAIFSLLLIAEDRNCAVNSPLHYSMTITKKKTGILILGTWISALLLALPPVFGVTSIEYRQEWHTCHVTWYFKDPYTISYGLLLTILGFLFPFIKISCIYTSMFKAARMNSARARKHSINSCLRELHVALADRKDGIGCHSMRRKVLRRSSSASQNSFLGEEWKAAFTGLLVVLSFAFCWMPLFSIILTEHFFKDGHWISDYVIFLVTFASFTACVINPYLYVFRNKTSRSHMKKMLECGYNRKDFFSKYRKKNPCGLRTTSSHCILKISSSVLDGQTISTPVPTMYEDNVCQWQMVSTSDEIVSGKEEDDDEQLDTISNDSENSVDNKDSKSSPLLNHSESKGIHDGKESTQFKTKIFSLRPSETLVHQDSIGSESSDNGLASFDNSTMSDESNSWYFHFMRRKDSKSSMVTLLVKDSARDARERFAHNRQSSLNLDENEMATIPSAFSRVTKSSSSHTIADSCRRKLVPSDSTDDELLPSSESIRPELRRQHSSCVPYVS